jgi:hypothetical protein
VTARRGTGGRGHAFCVRRSVLVGGAAAVGVVTGAEYEVTGGDSAKDI